MSVIKAAGDGVVFKGDVRRFNRLSGHQVGKVYEGEAGAILALYAQNTTGVIGNSADDADFRQDGATAELTLWYSGTEPNGGAGGAAADDVFDTWELIGNTEQKSIYQHRKALKLTTAQIAFIKYAVEGTLKDPTWTTSLSGTDATVIFNHALADYDGYLLPQFVLRLTRTVGSLYSGDLDYVNVLKLLTTAQLKAAENIPQTIQIDLDTIDANLPALGTGGSLNAYFAYRWLKFPPTKTQTGRNKFNLVYEYWHAAWSSWLYDAVS